MTAPAGFRLVGPALDEGQREVLAGALSDAIAYREPSGFCEDCEADASEICDTHAADVLRCDSYERLADELALEVPR